MIDMPGIHSLHCANFIKLKWMGKINVTSTKSAMVVGIFPIR